MGKEVKNHLEETSSVRRLSRILSEAFIANEQDFDLFVTTQMSDEDVLRMVESVVATAFRDAGVRVSTKFICNGFQLPLSSQELKSEYLAQICLGNYKGTLLGRKNAYLIKWRLHVRRANRTIIFDLENCQKWIEHSIALTTVLSRFETEVDDVMASEVDKSLL